MSRTVKHDGRKHYPAGTRGASHRQVASTVPTYACSYRWSLDPTPRSRPTTPENEPTGDTMK